MLGKAESVFGGLSRPSKMPTPSFGLPAWRCKVGSALRKLVDSVCAKCYAMAGRYVMPNVAAAQNRRFDILMRALADPTFAAMWVDAFVSLIKRYDVFRWHDSGDLWNVRHLELICQIAARTPKTRHWLPTKEVGTVKAYVAAGGVIPSNLRIRISAAMVDELPPVSAQFGSMVYSGAKPPKGVYACPIYSRPEHKAANCRDVGCMACWGKTKVVGYPKH